MSKTFTTTYSGQRIPADPDQLTPDIFDIRDVAWALGNQQRFNGHVDERWTVAQHSVLVARLLQLRGADPLTVMAGLLHDAHEAYIGDVAAPQKAFIPGWDAYERAFMHKVQRAFDLDPRDQDMWAEVALADQQALYLENLNFRRCTPDEFIRPGFSADDPTFGDFLIAEILVESDYTWGPRDTFLIEYTDLETKLRWI